MTRTIFDIEPDETAEREIFKSAFVDSNAEIACVVRWMLRIGPAKAERLFNAAMEKITSPHEPERGRPQGSVDANAIDTDKDIVKRWKASGLSKSKFAKGKNDRRQKLYRATKRLND